MRRADVIWFWDPTDKFTDVTEDMGNGLNTIPLVFDKSIYIGCSEILSGLFVQINNQPDSLPTIVIETYDSGTNAWQRLPVQERIDQLPFGHYNDFTGYNFYRSGVVNWNLGPWTWTLKKAGRNFPQVPLPPTTPELYWVKVTNKGSVPVTINRILPVLYNTYVSLHDVATFMGLPDFTEDRDPLATYVRSRIRVHEDWLDDYTRRSWRLRSVFNERHTFNPWGIRFRKRPIWFITRMGVWAGNQNVEMWEGRNKDFYVDNDASMIYFTRIALGRGLPWATIGSRYLRVPSSVELDYVYGEDFELSDRRSIVQDIILKRVGHDLVYQYDWTAMLINNPDAVPKSEKARGWLEQSEEAANQMRTLLLA